jgi:hypothetical protein
MTDGSLLGDACDPNSPYFWQANAMIRRAWERLPDLEQLPIEGIRVFGELCKVKGEPWAWNGVEWINLAEKRT